MCPTVKPWLITGVCWVKGYSGCFPLIVTFAQIVLSISGSTAALARGALTEQG